MPETLCSEFTCTGATLCDDSDGVSDCGYCGTCCEPTLESVCGYTDYTQNSSAILALNTEGLCYEPIDCNADTDLDSAVNRCRISISVRPSANPSCPVLIAIKIGYKLRQRSH